MVVQASAEREQRAGTATRRLVLPVVIGLAILQALWIVSVPPFRASDEFDHAYRAASAAQGQWWANEPAEDGRGNLVRVPAELVTAAQAQCEAMLYTGPDNCVGASGSESDGTVLVATAAGAYNPAYYWVVGTAARPFSGTASLYAMRVASAALCLLFLGLAAWAIAVGARSVGARPGWRAVGLTVSLTPVFVYSTSITAPNGLEMAAAMALWCSLLAAPTVSDSRTTRRLVLVAATAAVVVSTLRMLGPLFVLITVLLVMLFHGAASVEFVKRAWRSLLPGALAVLTSVFLAGAWILRTGLARDSQDEFVYMTWSPATLIRWPLQTIAAFPYRDQPGPLVVYPIYGVLVCVVAGLAWRRSRGSRRAALAIGIAIALLLPIVMTALTRSGQGVIWQGRYGLPVAVGFVLMAGVVLERTRARPRPVPLALSGLAMAMGTAACLVKIVQDEATRTASASDPAWWAVPTAILAVGSLLAYAILLVAIVDVRSPTELEPDGDLR